MNDRYLIFTGRPNAGKSTLIKQITGIRVPSGKQPGTTRKVSLYGLCKGLYLVDTPGYGRISKVSRSLESRAKNEILDFIENYSKDIVLAVHVLDISTFREVTWRMERKGLIPLDLEMIQYIKDETGKVPLVAANKIDKAGSEVKEGLLELNKFLKPILGDELQGLVFPTSGRTKKGIGVLKAAIHRRLFVEGFKSPFAYAR
jgi:GTP-binding protein EngB required for normal cell division